MVQFDGDTEPNEPNDFPPRPGHHACINLLETEQRSRVHHQAGPSAPVRPF